MKGDSVFMSIDAFKKREQALELRAKIMEAEEERLSGAKTRSISQARKELRECTAVSKFYQRIVV